MVISLNWRWLPCNYVSRGPFFGLLHLAERDAAHRMMGRCIHNCVANVMGDTAYGVADCVETF